MDPDSIDISSDILNDTITIDMNSIDTTWLTGASGSNAYTYTGTSTNYAWNTIGISNTAWNTTSIDHALQVKGDSEFDGDITVRGRSLTDFMDSVEQRLNILRPNAELESEWDQLRELGEQYRKLERQLTEKARMWAALQHTQPPVDK
jgi:hypothetical protein